MTALVGIFCKDGIVIGADSAATSATAGGQPTVEQPVMKIQIIEDRIIIAGTGAFGLGQRFHALVGDAWRQKQFANKTEIQVAKMLSHATIQDLRETFLNPGQFGALVAYPCKTAGSNGCHLVEFAVQDFQPEFKTPNIWYVSMGSGQSIIDPFLGFMREIFWQDGPPTVQDGVFAATWLLDHAVALNPGGVNAPVRIAVLENVKGDWKARLLTDDDLLEHRANQESAKDALRNFKRRQAEGEGAVDLPEAPASVADSAPGEVYGTPAIAP